MKNVSKPTLLRGQIPFVIGTPALIWQALFFLIPLLLVVITSFFQLSEIGKIEKLTFDHILTFFSPTYLKVIAASLLLALTNALLCLVVAFPLAYFLAFSPKKTRNPLLFFLIVPFWTNFLLHVYAWFYVLESHGFLNTLLLKLHLISEPIAFLNSTPAVLLMMVYYYLPFMVLPLFSSLERLNYHLIEAAYDLGGGFVSTFRKIVLPLSARGIRAGIFLVFIPSFGEFVIPELMGGDRHMFVGTVVSQYILGEGTSSLGSAFTLVSTFFLILTTLILYRLIVKVLSPKRKRYE